jgi:hypothetical protein
MVADVGKDLGLLFGQFHFSKVMVHGNARAPSMFRATK